PDGAALGDPWEAIGGRPHRCSPAPVPDEPVGVAAERRAAQRSPSVRAPACQAARGCRGKAPHTQDSGAATAGHQPGQHGGPGHLLRSGRLSPVDRHLVLVVSESGDWSADTVVNELRRRDVPTFRLDTGDFPQRMRVNALLRDGWTGSLETDGGELDLRTVTAVYYRRPRMFDLPAGLSGPERRFAQQQARVGLGVLLTSLPARWINHPSAIADAEYKPRQLAVAASVGFVTPATLITNDPAAVRDFAVEAGDRGVRPLTDPLVYEAGDTSIVYTRRLKPADLVDLSGVETTAHLFQQWIEPEPYAVRLTVVGDSMFGVAIHPESPAA